MEAMGNWANDEKLAAEAMARIAPEAAALPLDQLTKVNLDLQQATATILGVLPEVMALREQIVKELPTFDITPVDKLEDYALALRYAHAAYQTAMQPPDALKDLAEEAGKLRERLLADAQALSLRELIDPRKLDSLKGSNGIHNIAQDLQMLSQVLQESWPQIQGKTPASAEEVQAASRIATRITRIVGVRAQSSPEQDAAIEQRERVFALTMRAYDETRAAVAYLRRAVGDAETITPNLYSGRGRYRSPTKPTTDNSQTAGGTNTTPGIPAVTPEAAAAAAAVSTQNGNLSSKGPFLS